MLSAKTKLASIFIEFRPQAGELLGKQLLLQQRIVQLGVRVGNLHAGNVQLESSATRSSPAFRLVSGHNDG